MSTFLSIYLLVLKALKPENGHKRLKQNALNTQNARNARKSEKVDTLDLPYPQVFFVVCVLFGTGKYV
jgi:hypothetical protein